MLTIEESRKVWDRLGEVHRRLDYISEEYIVNYIHRPTEFDDKVALTKELESLRGMIAADVAERMFNAQQERNLTGARS